MLRRLFTIASVLSLLLCVATVVMWARAKSPSLLLGGLLAVELEPDYPKWIEADVDGSSIADAGLIYWNQHTFLGFVWASDVPDFPITYYSTVRIAQPPWPWARLLIIPYWFVVLITAVMPIAKGFAVLRGSRPELTGLCLCCGYDLRASKDRCPECGTRIGETGAARR